MISEKKSNDMVTFIYVETNHLGDHQTLFIYGHVGI